MLLLGLALLLIPGPAESDTVGSKLVGFINAMRSASAIPAGITENPVWSAGCEAHNHYGATNDILTHDESSTAPAYTPDGARAGQTSVLYRNLTWTAASNPFEHSPIHLHQLLAPRLDAVGAWESEGFGCATTLSSRNRSAPPRNVTYTYPRDGATGWRTSEVAAERPLTPGELLGIAPGTETGPYLYVLFDGPGVALDDAANVTTASLTGPGGPVSVAVADNTTPGLEGYLPVGAQLIPRQQLRAGTTYTATVSAIVGGARFTHRWSFQTDGPNADPKPPPAAVAAKPAIAVRSAASGSSRYVPAVRVGAHVEVRVRCPRACLVKGVARLTNFYAKQRLPRARVIRWSEGIVRLRFPLSHGARRFIATHRGVRVRLKVLGPHTQTTKATLPYALRSGSSSAYLPLASSVPSRG